jgi:hypothetical protein
MPEFLFVVVFVGASGIVGFFHEPFSDVEPLPYDRDKHLWNGGVFWCDALEEAPCGIEGFCSGSEVVLDQPGEFVCESAVDGDGGGLRCGVAIDVAHKGVCVGQLGDIVEAVGVVQALLAGRTADGVGETVSDFSDGMGDESDVSGDAIDV